MRLSLHTDFALRTLIYLAAADGQRSIAEIAGAYGISKNHLMKVAQRLAAEGFVDAVRGRSGGLRLARAASAINLGRVVRALEDTGAFVECFDPATNTCAITPVCRLKHVLGGGIEAFLGYLDQFTLADICADPAALLALLEPSHLTPSGT
ncbi:MAG: RrF2 family transcriptional regulator [Novosphingobium sp.]